MMKQLRRTLSHVQQFVAEKNQVGEESSISEVSTAMNPSAQIGAWKLELESLKGDVTGGYKFVDNYGEGVTVRKLTW